MSDGGRRNGRNDKVVIFLAWSKWTPSYEVEVL